MSDPDAAARELLRDAFTRLIEHVDVLTDGLTEDEANYRPSPSANSIAWLIWHSARVQDFQLAPIAGVEQVWQTGGWVDRFGLALPSNDTGYGHGPNEVAKVQAPADLLAGYYHAVHELTLEFVAGVTARGLGAHRRPQLGSAGDRQRPHRQHHRRLRPASRPGRLPPRHRARSGLDSTPTACPRQAPGQGTRRLARSALMAAPCRPTPGTRHRAAAADRRG